MINFSHKTALWNEIRELLVAGKRVAVFGNDQNFEDLISFLIPVVYIQFKHEGPPPKKRGKSWSIPVSSHNTVIEFYNTDSMDQIDEFKDRYLLNPSKLDYIITIELRDNPTVFDALMMDVLPVLAIISENEPDIHVQRKIFDV